MAEPRPADSGEPSAQPEFAAAPPSGTANGEGLPTAVPADALGLNGLAPTDDKPTIISRNPPRQPAGEPGRTADVRGRRLAHFELIEPVGVGGMAAVIRARDTQLDRLVALKILPPEMAQDPENVRRFHQEARAAARLDHENIARVFFCGEDQQLHFIAFEFVEGDNLRTILQRRGRVPVPEALHYILQIATGLIHAASRGVVHRDIKPSNIIITPAGRAKLVDMGLARSLESQSDAGLTQSGVTLGTFDYISPEQALEPREADARSDVYSLGCTFYHMITGQPPVPEGTAAKKLHHHQHIRPTDPRQLVPDLPDDVALILDRMMAKRPTDRYQAPEQLVHELLIVARRLGVAPEFPTSTVMLGPEMDNRPTRRPLLAIPIAIAALLGLIFVLGQPPRDRPGPQNSNWAATTPDGIQPRPSTDPLADSGADPAATAVSPREQVPAEEMATDAAQRRDKTAVRGSVERVARYKNPSPTAEDLATWLEEHRGAARVEILLAADINLSPRNSRNEQGLLIRNPEVLIRPLSRGTTATIRFAYDNLLYAPGGPAVRAPLTFLSQHVQVEGIRFLLDVRGSRTAMTGLWLRGGRQHDVRDCTFIQIQPSYDSDARLSSVRLDAEGSSSHLALTGCAFLGFGSRTSPAPILGIEDAFGAPTNVGHGGQDAVVARDGASLDVQNCAFGPHASIFHLEGADVTGRGELALQNCSVLAAGPSAIFDLGPGARTRVRAARCLFAKTILPDRTDNAADTGLADMAAARRVVLLRQPPSTSTPLPYQGQDNRYANLDAYLEVGETIECADWGEFRSRLAAAGSRDDSQELRTSPWSAAEPLKLLAKEQLAAAFRADAAQPDLRLRREGGEHLVGVERLGAMDYLKDLPRLAASKPDPTQPRILVVQPGQQDQALRVYPSLEHALPDIQPGDVIVLRQDGELRLDPVVLAKKEHSDITLRPDRGYHPILTLSEAAGGEPDAVLFRLHDGRLTLENMEIRLRPAREDFEAQTVVALAGDGQFTLRDCVITLDRSARKASLAVAILPDPGKRMMDVGMTPARPRDQGPRLILERCFVRGEGDLFKARASRPCEVEIHNSLLVLTGSALDIEAARDATAGGLMVLTLDRVTTCTAASVLSVRAGKDLKGLTPLECRPTACLFVPSAPSGDRVLVHLEGPESDETGLKDKVRWLGGANAYGAFNNLLTFQAPEDGKMPQPSTLEGWKKFSGDTDGIYRNVELAAPPLVAFTQVLPADFRPGEAIKGKFGADIADLPRPRGESPRSLLPEERLVPGG